MILELQNRVRIFVKTHDLECKLQSRLLDLVAEVGELAKAELTSSHYGRNSSKPSENWQEEVGDVFFSLICLANSTETDLGGALDAVMAKYAQRISKTGSPAGESAD